MSRTIDTAKVVLAMERNPRKWFGSLEVSELIGTDITLRSVQRLLKIMADDGVLMRDTSRPKGYRLAI